MLTIRVRERVRNNCGHVTGPRPERVRSILAGVNANTNVGERVERDRNANRNANRNRCEHGISEIIVTGRTKAPKLAQNILMTLTWEPTRILKSVHEKHKDSRCPSTSRPTYTADICCKMYDSGVAEHVGSGFEFKKLLVETDHRSNR